MTATTRTARVNTSPEQRSNAQLETEIFEAIGANCITTTGQLAEVMGLRVCDIHSQVVWLKRNGWIINIHSPEGWKIGMGGEK